MHEVFVNYRTGDGDMAAALIDQALSARFGKERIFRASKSINPGQRYADDLIHTVRHSHLLLAVIGKRWTEFCRPPHVEDWVRREILEAFASGVRVVPVIEGSSSKRLRRSDLPADLARLADHHSVRLDTRSADADLARIGDLAADMIPSLAEAEQSKKRNEPAAEPEPVPGSVHNSTGGVHGTAIQAGDITGDVGTVFKNNSGPVHTGNGDIHQDQSQNHRHFSGEGMTYFEGDNHGGVHNDLRRRREGDGR